MVLLGHPSGEQADNMVGRRCLFIAGESIMETVMKFNDVMMSWMVLLESGQTIWTDDNVNSVLEKTMFKNVMEINHGNSGIFLWKLQYTF